MELLKPSKGPWIVETIDNSERFNLPRGPIHQVLAEINGYASTVCTIEEHNEVPGANIDRLADAHLIAAAPELLKELNNLCGAISSLNSGKQHAIEMNSERVYWQREEWVRWMLDEMIPNARAAIAKAEAA